jgi:SAM-dependent methyltransferase
MAFWNKLRGLWRSEELESAEEEPAWENPGPLFRGARAWGRVRSDLDFLDAISVRVRNHNRRIDSTATLRLYDSARREMLREARRSTLELNDDSWQLFPFESVRDSEGKDFWFSLETDAEYEAIEIARAPDAPNVRSIDCRAVAFKKVSHLLDPLLFRDGRTAPTIPAYLERYLDRHIYQCVNLRRYFFPRLVHLADAIGRIPEPVVDALAIGVGVGYQEAFLAGRFPDMRVLATDVERQMVDFPMPNLAFERLDLLEPPRGDKYDLVFSIECLEHIEDYRTAFRHKAAMVRPGKYIYLSVPFASREEQRDPELRRMAWEENEHYTPGFAFEDIEELFAENGLEVLHASNMFFLDVMLPLRRIVDRVSAAELEVGVEEIARLMLLDVRDDRVASCRQAEGIRFLGRKVGE